MIRPNSISREELLKKAQYLLQCAKDGITKRRKQKSKRVTGSTNLLANAPFLYIEDEIKLYIDTAEAFRICSKWIDAAEAYGQAAWINGNGLKKEEEAAILYTEAGLCAMKFGIEEGEKYFQQAVSFYCTCGKYNQAGRIRQWIAESWEEANQFDTAISEYKMTLKYFEAKNMKKQVLYCERKIAHLLCLVGKYREASIFYQRIGIKELHHNLTKYNAHESFLKSSILLLREVIKGGEPTAIAEVHNNIKTFIQNDFNFEISASFDFLHNIIQILMNKDNTIHDFIQHLYDYDSLYPLDICCLDAMEEIMQLQYQDQLNEIDTMIASEK